MREVGDPRSSRKPRSYYTETVWGIDKTDRGKECEVAAEHNKERSREKE
jgi:hypothetical protein